MYKLHSFVFFVRLDKMVIHKNCILIFLHCVPRVEVESLICLSTFPLPAAAVSIDLRDSIHSFDDEKKGGSESNHQKNEIVV